MPVGVIVFDQKLAIIYCNKPAANFFNLYKPPEELTSISKRIFDAINASRLKDVCPGEIFLSRKLDGSPSNWTFRFHICENPKPLVSVFISEETVSTKLDLNKIRQRFRLTRRETDIIARAINGMKNTDIAEDLDISEQTVKDHLSNVYMKVGVENRFELVRTLINSPEELFPGQEAGRLAS